MYLLACATTTTTRAKARGCCCTCRGGEGEGEGARQRQVFIPVAALNACVSWMAAPRFHFRAKHKQHKHTHAQSHTHTYNTHTHWQIDITCLFCCLIKLWHMKLWLTSGWKGSWKGNLACLASPWHAKYFYHVCLLCWLSVLAINMHTLKYTHTHTHLERERESQNMVT